jgi:hypothetical protein
MVGAASGARHVTTRYQQIKQEVVDELQQAHLRGGELQGIAAWLSAENKRIIVAETLDADQTLSLPIAVLLSGDDQLGAMTDFKWAAIAERLLESKRGGNKAARDARAMALLTEVGLSPTASPMLSYESLYRDLAETALLKSDTQALDWLRRVLVHNLRYHQGDDVMFALVDLVSAYLQLDQLDQGLRMLAALIRYDPANQWLYRFMATGFGVLGLIDLGLRGARKGLALLDETGDPDDLHDELLMAEFDLLAGVKRGRESQVDADVLAKVHAALALDFDAGTPHTPEALCRELMPDFDIIPVKRPLRWADLPEAVQARVA